MKKANTTKKALLLSVLSMMLCCAMLVGSTFAWFTDSVTSGKNKIVAGNLDVELEYSLDGKTWTPVDENTNMFKKGALWEPGYTEVVYLQVKNAGTLALKYQLGINEADKVIGKTADDKDIDLAKFIEFGVVEAKTAFADRSAAREAVKASAGLISAGYSSDVRTLTAGETSDMLALVVYMPEEVGNAANHGTGKQEPEIYLGLSVKATQAMEENDSFGNDYDKYAMLNMTEAIIQGAKDSNAAIIAGIKKIAEANNTEVPENIDELVWFDEELTMIDDNVLATTLHFEEGSKNYVDITYTAVKALIGKAIYDQASNIKSIQIAFADVRELNGEAILDVEGNWVEQDLKFVMSNLADRTLSGALQAAQEYGLDVEIIDMDGNSQTYRMNFAIDANW